ncbi:MAG: GntR family transcriptional regulator [Myxococcota bacterium]
MTPLTLSQASGVPFWRQIHDQLADRIRAGTLAPGEALPSVRALAAELAVSVITTKKAYEELVRWLAEGAAGAGDVRVGGRRRGGARGAGGRSRAGAGGVGGPGAGG